LIEIITTCEFCHQKKWCVVFDFNRAACLNCAQKLTQWNEWKRLWVVFSWLLLRLLS